MRMNFSDKQKKTMSHAALVVGLACLFVGGMLAPLSVISLPAAWWLFKDLEYRRNIKAIESALPLLDGIYGGRHYVGKNAEVVKSKRIDNPRVAGPLTIEQLCKTKSGQWFRFRFSTRTMSGVPYDFDVAPCEEVEAKCWLEKWPDVYRKIFGDPEAA